MDIGFLAAFVGGVLTIASPCSVMLLPAFFAYAFTSPGRLLARTGVFYLGLITTLVPLGVLAGSLGAVFSAHRQTVVIVAAGLIIAFGIAQVLSIPLPGLAPRSSTGQTSGVAVFTLGAVYGLAGACSGPILGAVLSISALSGNALYGGVVLLVFAAGMALPLLLLAAAWTRWPSLQRLVRPRPVRVTVRGRTWATTWTQIIAGSLMIAIGILLIASEGTASLPSLLGAGDQLRLEAGVLRTAQRVPNLLVAGAALVILVGTATIVWLRRRATAQPPPR